jgi:V/A-type H+-transporting ATPase subunit E
LVNNQVELILPEKEKENIAKYFNDISKSELAKGTEITFDGNVKSGFRISPKGENYIISFTDEDFANYFKGFMRPKTIQLLFDEK